MKSKSNVSRNSNAKAAVEEVLAGVTNPEGILFFCDYPRIEEITEVFREIFPGDPCKGDFSLFGYGITHPVK